MCNTYISIKIRLLRRKKKAFQSDLILTGRGGIKCLLFSTLQIIWALISVLRLGSRINGEYSSRCTILHRIYSCTEGHTIFESWLITFVGNPFNRGGGPALGTVYLKQGKKPDPSPDFTVVDVATLCCFEIITWFFRVHTNMLQLQKHVCVSLESDLPFLLHTPASFPCWFHAWDFQKSLRCFSAQVPLTYNWGLCENPPAVPCSPVWMNKGVKGGVLLSSVFFLPFLLVPVILGSNSKPADIKESNFTRVALRPPPAQGEMPSLSHRTSTRQ